MSQIAFDINALVRENVKALKPYSSARDEYVSDGSTMVFLDANENPFENGVNRYPDPHQRSLKAVLAQQKGIRESQLLLGNGSDEVLDLLYRAFCEPGRDNVISLPPTYGMYQVLANINAVENREVLLSEDFEPEVDQILKTADAHSKLLFLCSPNNPSGNRFSAERIEALLLNFNGLVVVDEAYIDFSPEPSWATQLDRFPNLVICQTLSKAYGLAGIRLGLCLASEAIIEVLKKIKPPYNVNELTQRKALEKVLDTTSLTKEVNQILAERDKLLQALEGIGFISKIFPTNANFVLVRVDNANLRYQQLVQKGIVIRNRSTQPRCENTLRLTVGTPEENVLLLKALATLDQLQPKTT